MHARKLVAGMLFAVGLLFAGCGGAPSEDVESQDLGTREDHIPDCSRSSTGTTYYADATYSSVVGYSGCSCGGWMNWGSRTRFSVTSEECPALVAP